ncbi:MULTISPECIES: thioredoxin family protein [Legionella]|uniref:Putative thiol-disulfide isomerase n=1 Tax=Legionella drozanskii LLAP-1 TaxID=1212489 RepID=A0A0W0TET3_9GAMM|nr:MULTISPECIES: thioredoxin family protein [Legionella]KTC93733.1 putative thiol-disulfide isomerase [Legionella drozanskii LLAP-1]PJE12508.1 MAG: thioredoxin family protein [Legionella sp.]
MAKTPSNMLPLGTYAPQFSLIDVISNEKKELSSFNEAKSTVVMFICNHCPYVKHVSKELTRLANDYLPKGVNFIAINSNDIENYPDDSPENMKKTALEEGYPFPYLFDETQEVAKAYQAACTPDFFVFDANLVLVYRGQLDDSRPGNQIEVTGSSIRKALDCLLIDQPIKCEQKPSLGCNIKWKN